MKICDANDANKDVKIDTERGTVTFSWGDNLYEIELSQIKAERDLRGWIVLLGAKPWITRPTLQAFVETVSKYKGWEGWV